MPIADSVSFLIDLLHYVLPAAFLWAITDRAVKAVIRAATGKGAGI